MSDSKAWVEKLNINQDDFEEWKSQTPKGCSVTYWALIQQKLNEKKYLNWALEHYQLPLLESKFFSQEPDHQFFQMIQAVANWSEELVPLCMWDNTVFIGCVEPLSKNTNWSFPVQYVLAPSLGLQRYWKALHSQDIRLSELPALSEDLTAPTVSNDTATNQDKAPKVKVAEEQKVISAKEVNAKETDSISLQAATIDTADSISEPPIQDKTPSLDAPEGMEGLNLGTLTQEEEIAPADTAEPMEGLDLNFESLSLNTTKSSESIECLSFENLNLNTKSSDQAPEGVDLGEVEDVTQATEMPPAQEIKFEMPQPPVAAPTQTASQEGPPPPPTDSKSPESTSQIKQALEPIFTDMKKWFNHSILLLLEPDGLRPWIDDSSFQAKSDQAKSKINLDEPSLFRIVSKTKLPYHGHVVKTEINESFFKAWGFIEPPEHVTACPVKLHEDGLHSILLGIGKAPEDSLRCLSYTEKLATKIADIIRQAESRKAA